MIPWLDFPHIRSQASIRQILSYLGIWESFRPVASTPNQYRGPCPIHAVEPTRQKKREHTFSVNTENNVFRCFDQSCNASGNVFELWRIVQGLPLRESAWSLALTFNLETEPPESKTPESEPPERPQEPASKSDSTKTPTPDDHLGHR